MRIFEVKQSQFSDVADSSHSFSRPPKTVDLGIRSDYLTRVGGSPFLLAKNLGSDAAIDAAIERLIEHLHDVCAEAKELLATLKA